MKQSTNNDVNINISGSNNKVGNISQSIDAVPLNSEESTPLPKQIKDRIHHLIANNFLEEAIEVLDASTTNSQTKNMCLAVKRQLAAVKQELIAGTITVEQSNQQKQIITDKILKLKDIEL